MFVDSCLYKDFHKYIDIININNNFIKQDLVKITNFKSLYSQEKPLIKIHDYINRIMKYIYKDDSHIDGLIINVIILIKRVLTTISVNNYNIHRIIAGVFMLSQKVYDDYHYTNECWAYICGIQLSDINKIELDILEIIDYNTFIKHQEMLTVVRSIKYLD